MGNRNEIRHAVNRSAAGILVVLTLVGAIIGTWVGVGIWIVDEMNDFKAELRADFKAELQASEGRKLAALQASEDRKLAALRAYEARRAGALRASEARKLAALQAYEERQLAAIAALLDDAVGKATEESRREFTDLLGRHAHSDGLVVISVAPEGQVAPAPGQ